jgi:acyl-CoA synthetase (NDP forming)
VRLQQPLGRCTPQRITTNSALPGTAGLRMSTVAASFLQAEAVTIVGASTRLTAARELIGNLTSGDLAFSGKINLVNRKGGTVAGLPCETSLSAVAEPGIVVFLISGTGLVDALADLRGAPRLLTVYAENLGPAVDALQVWAKERQVPVVGPQSAGIVFPHSRIIGWTGALPEPIRQGDIAILSQSGGMLSGLLRRFAQRAIGLRAAISCGLGLVTSCTDLADALLSDDGTRLLVVYAEALNALEIARLGVAGAKAGKPVILLNPGNSPEGRSAVESHVRQASTDHQVLRGLAEQFGICLATDPEDVVWMAEGLAAINYRRHFPRGVAVVATSGGAGAVAADALDAAGVPLQLLDDQTRQRLSEFGGERAVYNPFDLGAAVLDSDPAVYEAVVSAILADPAVGVILETTGTGLSFGIPSQRNDLAPRGHDEREARLINVLRSRNKVGILSSPLAVTDLPLKRTSEANLLAAAGAHRSAVVCRALVEWAGTIGLSPELTNVQDIARGSPSRRMRRGVWSGEEAKAELKSLSIRWPASRVVQSTAEARRVWEELGGPTVVAKTEAQLPHKFAQGGVLIGLKQPSTVVPAVELLLARFEAGVSLSRYVSHIDEYLVGFVRRDGASFIAIGPGGVSARDDMSLRLCPCPTEEVDRVVSRLWGPAQASLVHQLLMDIQAYALARPEISSLELNPVVFGVDGDLYALDAKIHISGSV